MRRPAHIEQALTAIDHFDCCREALRTMDMRADQLKYHYVMATVVACEGNVSAAAKRLGMQRRTMQRIMAKRWKNLTYKSTKGPTRMTENHKPSRDELAVRMLCTWNNIDRAQAPDEWFSHANEFTRDAWLRVAEAVREFDIEEALERADMP